MYSLAHQATIDLLKEKEFVVLILVHAKYSVILDDGSQPELGSVLL